MTKPIKNILVPVNFSDSSENSIKTGIAMSLRHQAALHLLFVRKDNNLMVPPGKNAEVLGMALQAEVAFQDKLESQARAIEAENSINCFYHTAEGPFYKTVATIAQDFYCDLIVVEKSRSRNPFSLIKARSVYQLLKHGDCPVLSIPAEKNYQAFKKILFPVRPLSQGLDKMDVALPIIEKNESDVLLFGPLRPGKKEFDYKMVSGMINKARQLITSEHNAIERELGLTEDMATGVVNKAVERNSDLIIISATIKKGIKAVFVRNYTERVIDSSPVPVLSVKS